MAREQAAVGLIHPLGGRRSSPQRHRRLGSRLTSGGSPPCQPRTRPDAASQFLQVLKGAISKRVQKFYGTCLLNLMSRRGVCDGWLSPLSLSRGRCGHGERQ